MKRSQKFQKMAIDAFLKAIAWSFLAITAASLGWAYREHGWPCILFAVSFLMLFFSCINLCDGFNKKRLAKVERQWEKRRAIRNMTQSL